MTRWFFFLFLLTRRMHHLKRSDLQIKAKRKCKMCSDTEIKSPQVLLCLNWVSVQIWESSDPVRAGSGCGLFPLVLLHRSHILPSLMAEVPVEKPRRAFALICAHGVHGEVNRSGTGSYRQGARASEEWRHTSKRTCLLVRVLKIPRAFNHIGQKRAKQTREGNQWRHSHY